MADIVALQQMMPDSAPFSANEILSTLIEHGMVDPDGVRHIMNKKRTEKLLSYHNHKIWKGDDGRWRTFLSDPDRPKGRKLVSRASEEELKVLLCEYYSEREEELRKKSMTMEDLLEEWLAYKGKRFSKSTIERNRSAWRSLYAGEPIVSMPIYRLTSDMIAEWMEEKIAIRKMNKHQYNSFSSVIRQMMEYAVKIGIIDSNPVENIKIMNRELRPEPKKTSETQVFMPDERGMVIRYALEQYRAGRNYTQRFVPLAIAFLLSVSLRRGEVTALRFEDLNGRNLTLSRAFSHGAGEIVERLKDAEGWRDVYVVPSALEIVELVRST